MGRKRKLPTKRTVISQSSRQPLYIWRSWANYEYILDVHYSICPIRAQGRDHTCSNSLCMQELLCRQGKPVKEVFTNVESKPWHCANYPVRVISRTLIPNGSCRKGVTAMPACPASVSYLPTYPFLTNHESKGARPAPPKGIVPPRDCWNRTS